MDASRLGERAAGVFVGGFALKLRCSAGACGCRRDRRATRHNGGLLLQWSRWRVYRTVGSAPDAAGWFDNRAWLVLAVVSALLGALLMLAQRDVKRMLAYSTIEDMGYLCACVALASEPGMQGALIGAGVHALAKAVLFMSLAAPEANGPVTLARSGLAARYPASGGVFIVGALAMLGVPPTIGFAARWRIYETAYQAAPVDGVFMLATAFALLAFVRVIARCWWGTDLEPATAAPETPVLKAAMIALAVLILTAGLWPGALALLAAGG